jgi:hypothetical protein
LIAKKTESSLRGAVSASLSSLASPRKKKKANAPFAKDDISQPAEFKHVAHMGFDSEKGFTMDNIDPSWAALMQTLGTMGISEVRSPSLCLAWH